MAKMIPAEISTDANRFERDLFEKFKKIPAKWTIFHSFFVGTGGPRPRELDFVILIPTPKSYSVVYLEAKGGRYSIKDRQWFRGGELVDRRAPTDQARSGMFELQKQFEARYEHFSGRALRLSFSYAVAFTDWDISSEVTGQADVTEGALLMGGRDVQNGNRMMQLLGEHANEARKKFDRSQNFNSIERWNKQEHEVAAMQLKAMEDMLNPPTKTLVTSNTFFRHNLDTLLPELLEPTPSQTTALTLIKGNDRCVIDGAAGTGKTVLAMESVRQRCEQDGDIVAILCSNPLLSSRFEQWAETLSAEQGGRVMAGTPASLLARAFADDPAFLARHQQRLDALPNLERALKWGDLDNGWMDFVENTLKELEGKPAVFDYLVIDEAQNLYDDVFLRLLDKLLKGGLAHGRWTMFGDFTNQNIVTPRRGDRENVYTALLDSFGVTPTRWRLDTNCRNTYEIAAAAYDITDIEAPTLPGLHGPEVEYRYFDSNDQLHDLLEKQLAEWDSYGFESRQIIMLSSGDDNIVDENRQYGNWKLVNIADAPAGSDIRVSSEASPYVWYSNIFDFQGLESDLVILVLPIAPGQTKVGGHITLPYHNYLNRLLYIAMSRANAMLVVMADEGYKVHLQPDTAFQPA